MYHVAARCKWWERRVSPSPLLLLCLGSSGASLAAKFDFCLTYFMHLDLSGQASRGSRSRVPVPGTKRVVHTIHTHPGAWPAHLFLTRVSEAKLRCGAPSLCDPETTVCVVVPSPEANRPNRGRARSRPQRPSRDHRQNHRTRPTAKATSKSKRD